MKCSSVSADDRLSGFGDRLACSFQPITSDIYDLEESELVDWRRQKLNFLLSPSRPLSLGAKGCACPRSRARARQRRPQQCRRRREAPQCYHAAGAWPRTGAGDARAALAPGTTLARPGWGGGGEG
eukprot:6187968-Pleurochrysis_carterae.AAC.2